MHHHVPSCVYRPSPSGGTLCTCASMQSGEAGLPPCLFTAETAGPQRGSGEPGPWSRRAGEPALTLHRLALLPASQGYCEDEGAETEERAQETGKCYLSGTDMLPRPGPPPSSEPECPQRQGLADLSRWQLITAG